MFYFNNGFGVDGTLNVQSEIENRKKGAGEEEKKIKEPQEKTFKWTPPPKLYFPDIQQIHISCDEWDCVAPGGIAHLWCPYFMKRGYLLMAHVIICDDGDCVSLCVEASDLLANSTTETVSSVLANVKHFIFENFFSSTSA